MGIKKLVFIIGTLLICSCGGFKGERYDVEVEVDLSEVVAEQR